jgi:hypothetical protein
MGMLKSNYGFNRDEPRVRSETNSLCRICKLQLLLILLAPSLACMTPMVHLWTLAWYVRWNFCIMLHRVCTRCTSCTRLHSRF